MPNRSNLSKLAVAFAVLLLLTLGLCGFAISPAADGFDHIMLAIVALIGLLISIAGLIVTGIIAVVRNYKVSS